MKYCTSLLIFAFLATGLCACNDSSVQETVTGNPNGLTLANGFAGGTKGVKIYLNTNALTGSFVAPIAVPAATPIPSPFPGYDGSAIYNPGVQATQFFALDGTSVIGQPGWLYAAQLGMTQPSAGSACASFGGSGTEDVSNTYRVSEIDCARGVANGTGSSIDPVFVRFVLNRDPNYLGLAENLLVQVEYQAQGIHLNSDGVSTNVEDNLDQLWKIFWNSSLNAAVAANPFSVFVPPAYSACVPSGTESAGAPGACNSAGYHGSAKQVKQFIIPLSAYPNMRVIQFSRVKGRVTALGTFPDASPLNYVASFCGASATGGLGQQDSPLCAGVVIYSVTLMRM